MGCDLKEPELRGALYSHVGLYASINQMRTRWWYKLPIHARLLKSAWGDVQKLLKQVEVGTDTLKIAASTKSLLTGGSLDFLVKYHSEIELDPTPRIIKDSVKYIGRFLG